jgi:hypothetical protein
MKRRASASMLVVGCAAVFALAAAHALAAPDPAERLKDFMGTYLGRATVKDFETQQSEEREIDVEIAPYKDRGFRIRWVNVTLVNGRRDVAGVKRRVAESAFVPAKGHGYYVEVREGSVFAEREEVTPMGGDALRWAVIDGRGMHVHSFVVQQDGRYELQSYSRRRTGGGLELAYERVVDGKRTRTIEGRAIKVE